MTERLSGPQVKLPDGAVKSVRSAPPFAGRITSVVVRSLAARKKATRVPSRETAGPALKMPSVVKLDLG